MAQIISGQTFRSIVLTHDGIARSGPWTFASDGAGCMYPRFVNEKGDVVPWHAVAMAYTSSSPHAS